MTKTRQAKLAAQAKAAAKERQSVANREEWLNRGYDLLYPALVEGMETLELVATERARVKFSCGLPPTGGAAKGRKRKVGATLEWDKKLGRVEVFISPTLGADTPIKEGVIATLIHEAVHTMVGTAKAHNKAFRRLAEHMGLQPDASGDWSRTEPTKAGLAVITRLTEELGPYPHLALTDTPEPKAVKPGSRQIKVECDAAEHIEGALGKAYSVRLSRQLIDTVGLPVCPCGQKMHEADK